MVHTAYRGETTLRGQKPVAASGYVVWQVCAAVAGVHELVAAAPADVPSRAQHASAPSIRTHRRTHASRRARVLTRLRTLTMAQGLATALGMLLFVMNTVQVILDIRNRTVSDDDSSRTCGNN